MKTTENKEKKIRKNKTKKKKPKGIKENEKHKQNKTHKENAKPTLHTKGELKKRAKPFTLPPTAS